jgi:hypothetical protein
MLKDKDKPERLMCEKCRERGHLMWVYVQPFIDSEDSQIKYRTYNYASQTRHFHMIDQGTDFW